MNNQQVIKKDLQIRKPIEKWAKRSLVSIKNIKKDQILKAEDFWSKRPGTGIPSRFYDNFIGKKQKKKLR